MEKLSNSSHFLDLGGLDSLRNKAQKDEKGALREVAQQFEGIFVQMLMKSMRQANAVFESDSPMNSQYTKFYEQMHDQQMSMDLSNKGMLGLADLMVQQLDPDSSALTPASGLRGSIGQPMAQNKPTDQIQPFMSVVASASDKPIDASKSVISLAEPPTNDKPIRSLAEVLSGQVSPSVAAARNTGHFASPDDFVNKLYPHAEKAAKALGTSPELLIAQSALETGWGQKVIKTRAGDSSNNLFNIKADKRWQGDKSQVSTLEYEKGQAVKQKADFRVYDNIEQSFNDFVSFISNNARYQDAKSLASKPTEFIHALQKAGYATDPQYANKVINVMKSIAPDVKNLTNGGVR